MVSKGEDLSKISNQIVDMLVGSTLKRHGVKLGEKEIDPKEKEEIKKMVNNLKESVEALSKTKKTEKSEDNKGEKTSKDDKTDKSDKTNKE